MKIHAAAVEEEPKADKAEPKVEYSPAFVPEFLTVKQPVGVLVRDARFTSASGAATTCNVRLVSKRMRTFENHILLLVFQKDARDTVVSVQRRHTISKYAVYNEHIH